MIMELNSVLVTGANRGIGLEFVRQLSRLPKPPRFIFATYRSEGSLEPLTEIKNSSKECQVVLIKMDVNVPEDVVAARKVIEMFETVEENGITLLINNAGALKFEAFPNITEENLLYHFTTNTVGPIRVFQEMLPLLQKAASRSSGGMRVSRAAVLNISSVTGCIARTGVEFTQDLIAPGYKMSKAALHMAMRVISSNVNDQGILVICMCPGWVKTDMGTNHGKITPEESISTMLQTLQKLDDSHHGSFMDRFGNLCQF